jgi:hypothetical protein
LIASTSPLSFTYSIGGTAPSSQFVPVTVVPNTLPVAVTLFVTSPAGGTWLSASLGTDGLYVTASPWGLLASPGNPYTGYVQLYSQGMQVQIPVSLTINPQSALSIFGSHSGNFAAGQLGATYTVLVTNSTAVPTSGLVTVTEYPSSGMSVVSMTSPGNAWSCTTSTCKIGASLAPGQSYPPITVTVNVAATTPSPGVNTTSVSGGGSSDTSYSSDITIITPLTCTVTGDSAASVADVQRVIGQALGIVPATYDFNSDGVINVLDVQIVANAVLGYGCQ